MVSINDIASPGMMSGSDSSPSPNIIKRKFTEGSELSVEVNVAN